MFISSSLCSKFYFKNSKFFIPPKSKRILKNYGIYDINALPVCIPAKLTYGFPSKFSVE